MTTSERAGKTLEYIMKIVTDKQGKEFIDECLQILTLCTSEIIKAGFCPDHYESAINEVLRQIKSDFEVKD